MTQPTRTLNPAPCERGSALVVVLIGLALLALIGLWMGLSATSEVQISDNFEAELRARYASLAGINHARDALRGANFDEMLRGPDGIVDTSAAYFAEARTLSFRNPISWAQARAIDLSEPSGDLVGVSDDGIIHSGDPGSGASTAIVPVFGLPLPSGAEGTRVRARYFVKVSDNCGEPSEIAADPSDNPFVDGDSTILVRSIGCASTFRERMGTVARQNAIVVTEARLRRRSTFELEAPLVIQATRIAPAGSTVFSGNGFSIAGGDGHPGIGIVDGDPDDGRSPLEDLLDSLEPSTARLITGGGADPPSLADVGSAASAQSDKSLRLDSSWLWHFIHESVPRISDAVIAGGNPTDPQPSVNFGAFDPVRPQGDPAQDPRLTFVDGDLGVSGEMSGAGLLVVTGNLSVTGRLEFYGLILVLGGGRLTSSGGGLVLRGAVLVASLRATGDGHSWGEALLNIGGTTTLVYDASAIAVAISLIPPAQLGLREVTRTMDP